MNYGASFDTLLFV